MERINEQLTEQNCALQNQLDIKSIEIQKLAEEVKSFKTSHEEILSKVNLLLNLTFLCITT